MQSRSSRVAAYCALIAVATAGAAALATISVVDWNVTILVRMAPEQPLATVARESDPGFAFVHFHGRGDGVPYYAIARDPLALGEEHRMFMWAAYRYGHPGFSWMASLLSLGNSVLIPYVFLLLNLVGMATAAAAVSLIGRELGFSPWAGLLVALNPGLVYATTIDTSEPVAAALLAVALLLWIRGRWKQALPVLALLCFMKEWFVLVPLGLAVWEITKVIRQGRAPRRRLAGLALSMAPFAAWYLYVIVRFGEWPASPTRDLLQVPPTGWIQTARAAAEMGTRTFDQLVTGHSTVALLAVLATAFAFGIARAIRVRTPVDPVFLAFMPVVFAMNKWGLLYVKDLMREVAIPLLLLPLAALAPRRRLREFDDPAFVRRGKEAADRRTPPAVPTVVDDGRRETPPASRRERQVP